MVGFPLAFIAILLAISLPSMAIAWLKLRKRNLGPILDANGWAVNAKAKLNVPFGASLTGVAKLPEGAIPVADRFGEKPSAWPKIALFAVIVCFFISLLNHFYVLDLIAYKATGQHYPIFKQVPEKKGDDSKDGNKKDKESLPGGSTTNAPTASL